MDEKTYVPSLTLNPTQAAAQEAPAAPQLVVEEEKPAVEPEKLDIDRLSPEEQAAVREFAKQIDVTDTNLVLSYGAAAQKGLQDTVERLREMRREAANQIVTPGMPGFQAPPAAGSSGLVMP